MPNRITTFSKKHFNPLEPTFDDISIDDIAHSLSLMTRANGHFHEFYSVAQHSIFCCEEAIARGYSNRVSLACLLHDGSEAYLADITRPVKRNLNNYLEIEEVLQNTIYKKYLKDELTNDEIEKVANIDNSLLYDEFVHYMDKKLPLDDVSLVTKPQFGFVDFTVVENKFKDLFYRLVDKI